MKASLFKYLILSIIIAGSLTMAVDEAMACGNVTLTAEPLYFKADADKTVRIHAKVTAPDGSLANGSITFSVQDSPSPTDGFSKNGTVSVSNGSANINFYHHSSDAQKIKIFAVATITITAQDGSSITYYPTGYIELNAIKVELEGQSSITRGDLAAFKLIVLPSGLSPSFKWKFQGKDKIIQEDTGMIDSWGGILVCDGVIQSTANIQGVEFRDKSSFTIKPRNWKMANPSSPREVTAPSWNGTTIGQGTVNYNNDDEIKGNPGYVASGPNKGFYYISDSNYWEEWISFNWWITPGFRTSEGKFWITTKQIEGYMEKEVMSYIQGLIGHETDGTSTNSLGHRKIIISKIQGNPNYDPKSSIEEIISYNDIKALKNKYKQKIQATNNKFKKYYMNGENHPKWGNGHAKLWVTNPKGNKWGYMEPYW